MSLAERIANAFGGAKRSGKGWQCKCPCHDDRNASLGVLDDTQGGVIVNCFAGCKWEDIKQILKDRGLYDNSTISNRGNYNRVNSRSVSSGNRISSRANAASHDNQQHNQLGVIKYTYVDAEGNPVARKLRYPGKRFKIERLLGSSWVSGLDGLEVPLYNLPGILNAEVIYLCEGEKDADNLIKAELAATTSMHGAGFWRSEYNQVFEGKTVIICQDNDKAGKERTQKLKGELLDVAKQLLLFAPEGLGEGEDVSDWLARGHEASDVRAASRPFETEVKEVRGKAKSVKDRKATQADYFELFETVLNNPRRCIFSDKLMTFETHSGLWNPAINYLDIIKSEALVLSETTSVKYNMSQIQPHFFKFESLKSPELLVDIPEWDGEDRISAMCYAVQLKESAGVSSCSFSELVKEWCAGVFKRLEDPGFQNRFMIFQGGQGIGKDTLISMLVDGLGQFSVPLSIISEDKDTYINLSRGLVAKVSEFDKSAKTATSTIKDLITAPSTNLRAPYDREARVRVNRCSFISSANVTQLLRDYTGSRRFLVFEFEKIEYLFEGWDKRKIKDWQAQCLAEMVALKKLGYKASPESWREMSSYLDQQTPEDPADMFLDQFLANAAKDQYFTIGKEISTNDTELVELVRKTITGTRLGYGGAMALLKEKIGVYKRVGSKRFWTLKIPQIEYKRDEQSDLGW